MSSLADVRARLGALTGALVVLTPLSQLGFIPVSAVIGADLGVDAASMGTAIGLYAVSAAVGAVVLGPLFDLVPARRVLPWAVAANFAVSVGFIWASGLGMLVLGRVLAGFANSALLLSASVMIADAFRDRPGERDRAYSGLQTYVSTGAVSGLALGGLCAGLGTPWLYFAVVALYAAVVLCLSPLIVRRMRASERPAATARAAARHDDTDGAAAALGMRARTAALGRDVAVLVRAPQTVLLLLSTACVSWVLQGGHYSLSMLLNEEEPGVAIRTVLTVMIPIGVLLGALVNQWSLTRLSPARVYGRAYVLLPLVCGALGAALLSEHMAVWAVALVAVGTACGMLSPLQPTLIVGWYPEVRGSGSAAVNVAASAGAALGPVAVGALAAAWAPPGAAAVSGAVAVVGAVLAVSLSRASRRSTAPTAAAAPVAVAAD
ncbi:MFS transporter [Cellulomonas sp. NPDC057328]|uniref:MFS transporter n=1 Tax=Cellulomonas sp. NPDC057328 TaxID=3346101 RepID=UPI0036427651